ncbi:hypothetical protein O3M35_012622 [Rhynocoris fuscipes]|uniref:Uncharacterized protein n=1 Tax=Rhynocoris fuscipes TaxID=488301 RepID=A0AAW1CYQ3_9HEMI
MHQGYGSTTSSTKKKKQIVQKQLKRIYYNSSLDTTESVFPFTSVLQSKDNITLCKEKLQGQFQKCRDFLKDVPSKGKYSTEATNSSGVIKEVILENVGKKSKFKLLKCMQEMGLNMKQAAGNNETLIIVDLSPLGEDKRALNHFMSFVEKLKEKKFDKPKKNTVLSKKQTFEKKLSKTIESIYKRKVNIDKDRNESTLIDKVRSLRINLDYEDEMPTISIGSSDRTVKNIDIYQSAVYKDEGTKKQNNEKNTRNTGMQNLFRSTTPTEVKVTSLNRQTKMQKRSKMIKMLNVLRMLFFYKKDSIKDDDNPSDNFEYMAYPIIKQIGSLDGDSNAPSIYINQEPISKPRKVRNGDDVNNDSVVNKSASNGPTRRESVKKFGISPSVIIVDGIEDDTVVEIESQRVEKRYSIVDEPPATVWGRRVSPESRKELELIAQRQQNKAKQYQNLNADRYEDKGKDDRDKDEDKEKDKDIITTKILDQNYELHRILNQQIAIKDMIEKIQNSLERNQSCIQQKTEQQSSSSSFVCDRHKNADLTTADAWNHQQIRCTSSAPSNRATISSTYEQYCCHRDSFDDSMTDIPSSLCWCPDIAEKIRLLFGGSSRSRTSRLEVNMQCELEQQRREIIRLNNLLRRHILENRSS